jgi:murein DD-endopeptidase MepM/ murein hydrolase activator NlpD
MRFSIHFEHNGKLYQRQFSVRRVVSVLMLLSLVAIVSSRTTQLPQEHAAQVRYVKQSLIEQAQALEAIQGQSDQKLQLLVGQISQIQAQLLSIDAQQQQMAEALAFSLTDTSVVPPALQVDGSVDILLTSMQDRLDYQIKQLSILENVFNNTHIETQQRISGRPITSGWLSSYYGMRDDPFSGRQAMHKGIDFAGTEGDPVVATAAGVVTWSGERFGYGNLVEINHGNGLSTRYGHNHTLNVVVGEVVTKGQTIATIGNTGRSTGAHVHYEVIKQGKQIDPLPFVYRK